MARTQIAADNFNRANGDVGANWSYIRDTAWQATPPQITSNVVTPRANDSHYQVCRWNGAGTFSNDQYAKVTIGGLGFSGLAYRIGAVVRCSADTDTNADFYLYYVQDDSSTNRTTRLVKMVNGTETVLNTTTIAWANTDTIEIEAQGTTVRGFRNGIQQVSVTDSSLATGKPGFMIAGDPGGPPNLDNWDGGDGSGVDYLKVGVGYLGFKAAGTQEVPKISAGIGRAGMSASGVRNSGDGEDGIGRMGMSASGFKGGIISEKQNASSGSIRLAWDAPTTGPAVDGYRILWSVAGVPGPPYPNSVNVGNVLTYLLQGLTPRGTYEFVVVAYNSAGDSPYSNELSEFITYGMAYSASGARQVEHIREPLATISRIEFRASGVKVFTAAASKTGQGNLGLSASGFDSMNSIESGAGVVGMFASGADEVIYDERGSGIMGMVASGVGTLTSGPPNPFEKTGSGIMGFTGLGDWEALWVESGTGILGAKASGIRSALISIPTSVGVAKRRKRSEGRSRILSLSEDR